MTVGSRGALQLERAMGAIATARTVDQHAVVTFESEPQVFAAGADKGVVRPVEGKVVAREDAVCLRATVEYRNMRLYSALHQPRQIAAGTIGGVRRQPLGGQAEAFRGALDHGAGRRHFRRPARRRGFHIDDDRGLGVDQIVGAVGEGDLAAALWSEPLADRSATATSATAGFRQGARQDRRPCPTARDIHAPAA
jgi:hypothetical protein